jgi:hypothetical protein
MNQQITPDELDIDLSGDEDYPLPADNTFPKIETKDFDLDGLLAESMAERSLAELVKENRKRLAGGKVLDSAERAAIQQQIRDWEARREWQPVADIVMFSRQMCQNCGAYHHNFLGYYQQQQHRTSKIERWIKSTKPVIEGLGKEIPLPRDSKYEDSIVDLCHKCGDQLGWLLEED